jgi:predicted phage terminase large subunit-like protein
VKLDQYRPDLIVFDDVDEENDTTRTVGKKIDAITTALLPAGASDCALLFIQTLVHENGIVAQLVDGRADFLRDADVPTLEPAVRGLQTTQVQREDGRTVYRITGGEATWAGQDLSTCERQINDWGLRAFLREAQHEITSVDGSFFVASAYRIVDEPPPDLRWYCRAWDLAATSGGGDYTAGVLIGLTAAGLACVLDVIRGQWGSEQVYATIEGQTAIDYAAYKGAYVVRLPQDPGQAGTDQARRLRKLTGSARTSIQPVTGAKPVRARAWANATNGGNALLVRARWNRAFTEEMRRFREDMQHDYDDQVDAASDAYNEVTGRRVVRAVGG